MLKQLKQIWHLGLPLSLTFVIQMVIVMVDSVFAGNISYVTLAAVSLGSSTFYIFLLFLIGIGIASSVMAGQASGAGDDDAMLNCFRQGALLCLLIGFVMSIALLNLEPILLRLGQEPEVVALTIPYLKWFAWILPIQALIVLIRSYFAVIDRPWATVLPVIWALLLNTLLDYCLATGNLGFPAMGISGIGLASLISNIVLLGLMLRSMGVPVALELFHFKRPSVWQNNGLGKLFLVSSPIAVTLVTEEAFFSGSVFLAGYLGAAEQAAHQILFNTIGMSYLFNSGIAVACSILIGKCVGAGTTKQIMPIVKAGWVLAQVFTLPFVLILVLFGDQWINLFLDETLARNDATIFFVNSVMWIAIVILFVDTVWLVIIESLHGLLDTTYPAICAFAAYWVIGMPLAYWATQYADKPYTWLWFAMLLAICLLTVLVYTRLRYKIRQLNSLDNNVQAI